MKRFCIVPATLLALAIIGQACTKTAPEGSASAIKSPKIINTPSGVDKSSILVCLTKGQSEDALSELVGIDGGIVSYEKVFKQRKGEAERMKKYGLDRWYVLNLASGVNLESTANALAGSEAVQTVEYNTLYQRCSDARSYAYRNTAPLMTAVEGAFNDPMLPSQWDLRNAGDRVITPSAKAGADVNVLPAWKLCTGNKDIVVAVIDEGVQYTHPDLAANMWVNEGEIEGNNQDDDEDGYVDDVHGYNFAGKGQVEWSAYGSTGHGTHCAGVIAAVSGNGTGICGIAGGDGSGNGVRIMSCQIMQGWQGSPASVTAEAIRYAAGKAHIISCSWGFNSGSITNDRAFETSSSSSVTASALRYYLDTPNDLMDGGIAIFAAGNEGGAMSGYPGAYRDCISVTSIGADGLPAYYTNYGPGCNIIAPGGEYCTGGVALDKKECLILSTMPTEEMPEVGAGGENLGTKTAAYYGYMQGTSMACPHVTGVVALGLSYMKQLGVSLSRDEFVSRVLTSVNSIDNVLGGVKITFDGKNIGPVNLGGYRGNMGTGTIDAWKLLMNIEGTPYVSVKAGSQQSVGLEEYFGGDAANLTYLGVECDAATKAALGLSDDPYIEYGRLVITPTSIGAGKLKIRAIAGGSMLGGGSHIGGREISREVSIISRPTEPAQNGGWL